MAATAALPTITIEQKQRRESSGSGGYQAEQTYPVFRLVAVVSAAADCRLRMSTITTTSLPVYEQTSVYVKAAISAVGRRSPSLDLHNRHRRPPS